MGQYSGVVIRVLFLNKNTIGFLKNKIGICGHQPGAHRAAQLAEGHKPSAGARKKGAECPEFLGYHKSHLTNQISYIDLRSLDIWMGGR